MILLTLSRGKGEETVRLQLPASPAEIGETFAFLDRISLDILRFGDLLGKKKVSNPNFSDGILPHLWDDYGKVDWYVYQPTQADYRLLAGTVDEYLQVFQRQEEAQEHSPQMC